MTMTTTTTATTLEQVAADGGGAEADEARQLVAQQREKLERAQVENNIVLDVPKPVTRAEPKHEPGYIPPPAAFSQGPANAKAAPVNSGPSAPVSAIFGGEQDAGLFAKPGAARQAPAPRPGPIQQKGNDPFGPAAAAPPWEMAPPPAASVQDIRSPRNAGD